MAKDFSAIISGAKAKHEDDVAKNAAQRQSEREDTEKRASRATEFLNSKVLPLFLDAAEQLAAEGYPLQIKKNWEGNHRPSVHSITIQVEGPPKKNRMGGTTVPRSVIAAFSHDGERFTIGYGSELSSHPDRPRPAREDDVDKLVEAAIEHILTTYLAKIARYKQEGSWD